MDPKYVVLWIGWFVVILGGFAGIEGTAIKSGKPGRTLSTITRYVFGTKTRRGRWVWLLFLGGGGGVFFAWFVTHIAVVGSV